jgi:hypothetical protein
MKEEEEIETYEECENLVESGVNPEKKERGIFYL